MRKLLDHNLDRRLTKSLRDHETSTTQEQGWADVVNGELLRLAEANEFAVLLTADANIKNQQNVSDRTISILVLRAFNNRLKTHQEMLDDIGIALKQFVPEKSSRSFTKTCARAIGLNHEYRIFI